MTMKGQKHTAELETKISTLLDLRERIESEINGGILWHLIERIAELTAINRQLEHDNARITRAESGLVKELVTALNMVSGRCTPEAQLVVDAALVKAKPAAGAV